MMNPICKDFPGTFQLGILLEKSFTVIPGNRN